VQNVFPLLLSSLLPVHPVYSAILIVDSIDAFSTYAPVNSVLLYVVFGYQQCINGFTVVNANCLKSGAKEHKLRASE